VLMENRKREEGGALYMQVCRLGGGGQART
jgi:hypothetical protein